LEERKIEKENASANANKNSIYDRRKSFAKGKKEEPINQKKPKEKIINLLFSKTCKKCLLHIL